MQEKSCLIDHGLVLGQSGLWSCNIQICWVLDYRPRAIFRLFLSCSRLSSSSIKRSSSSSSCLAILALKRKQYQTWMRYKEDIQTGKPRMQVSTCMHPTCTALSEPWINIAQELDPSKQLNGMVEYKKIKCLIVMILKIMLIICAGSAISWI